MVLPSDAIDPRENYSLARSNRYMEFPAGTFDNLGLTSIV